MQVFDPDLNLDPLRLLDIDVLHLLRFWTDDDALRLGITNQSESQQKQCRCTKSGDLTESISHVSGPGGRFILLDTGKYCPLIKTEAASALPARSDTHSFPTSCRAGTYAFNGVSLRSDDLILFIIVW